MSLHKGFTLIELMVVIAIISILASLSVYGLIEALSSSDEDLTQMMIQDLVTSLEAYQTDYGVYPDAYIEIANIVDPDETGYNLGNETILLILRSKVGFPAYKYQDRLGNTDNDKNQSAYDYYGLGNANPEMFEILDNWGNPIVFIPEKRYGEVFIYVDRDGKNIEVQAEDLSLLGIKPQGYMIWSFGPDGVNQNGKGDDITSWKKSAEDKSSH